METFMLEKVLFCSFKPVFGTIDLTILFLLDSPAVLVTLFYMGQPP